MKSRMKSYENCEIDINDAIRLFCGGLTDKEKEALQLIVDADLINITASEKDKEL